MAKLEIADRLYTTTANGQREIQLCVGDITKLPMEEKVDVILISALPYNYAPTRTSVIGALMYNLGLSVRELSMRHVREDLRHSCFCWTSKELPDHLPYRQLLCYEPPKGRKGSTQRVGNIFRAMMPTFNNSNKTVISPLLASGIQSVPRDKILKTLVICAIEWMHIGLPLQCFKIVVYQDKLYDPMVDRCIEIFQGLSNNVKNFESSLQERLSKKGVQLDTDIFVVYGEQDMEIKKQVCSLYKQHHGEAVIRSMHDIETENESWLYQTYNEMIKSKRVILLLTRNFLLSEECIDAFNVALCVNRQCRRPLLAPLYLEDCDVPNYMSMMQWINCKPHDINKITRAVNFVRMDAESKDQDESVAYDVFLSYSHRNLQEAKAILSQLYRIKPNVKIFFDYDELRTGISWQQKLYDAITSSSCVIALVSPEYLSSTVCQEEFNLAMAQHLALKSSLELIPLVIKSVDTPFFKSIVTPIMALHKFDARIVDVCTKIVSWLDTGIKGDVFSPVKYPINYREVAQDYRRRLFTKYYTKTNNQMVLCHGDNRREKLVKPKDVNIHFSFVASNRRYAAYVESLLKIRQSCTQFQIQSAINGNLDKATEPALSVVFLSEDYSRSTKDMEELTILLGKLRQNSRIYIVVVSMLSANLPYLHLIPIQTNLLDDFWEEAHAQSMVVDESNPNFEKMKQIRENIAHKEYQPLCDVEVLGLQKVVVDITMIVNGQSLPKETQHDNGLILNVVRAQRSQNEEAPVAGDRAATVPKDNARALSFKDGENTIGAKYEENVENHGDMQVKQPCADETHNSSHTHYNAINPDGLNVSSFVAGEKAKINPSDNECTTDIQDEKASNERSKNISEKTNRRPKAEKEVNNKELKYDKPKSTTCLIL